MKNNLQKSDFFLENGKIAVSLIHQTKQIETMEPLLTTDQINTAVVAMVNTLERLKKMGLNEVERIEYFRSGQGGQMYQEEIQRMKA